MPLGTLTRRETSLSLTGPPIDQPCADWMPPSFRGWTPAKARAALNPRQPTPLDPSHEQIVDFRYPNVYPLVTL